MVLLGIRSSVKEDLGHSPSEMLYGENIHGPNEFHFPSHELLNETDFIQQLKLIFKNLESVDTRIVTIRKHIYLMIY